MLYALVILKPPPSSHPWKKCSFMKPVSCAKKVGDHCYRVYILHAQSFSWVWIFAIPWTIAPPGSSVHAISPERILEWVVISSSRRFSRPRDETPVSSISYVSWVSRIAGRFFITEPPGKSKSINWLFVTLWTVVHQGSSVHSIVQARILEWVANPYLRASSQPRKWTPGLLHCKQIPYSLNHPGS